jgi:hypothetical protein
VIPILALNLGKFKSLDCGSGSPVISVYKLVEEAKKAVYIVGKAKDGSGRTLTHRAA